MQADFSVELGHDDPVLELPWASDDPAVRYYDLKKFPELVRQIPEAAAHPELRAFLARINASDSPLETAKCDLWQSKEISPEEEIFGAAQKFVSYIDLLFTDEPIRNSFEKHEQFAGELCRLLSRAPDIAATVELIIRRCYYRPEDAQPSEGGAQTSRQAREDQYADKDLIGKEVQVAKDMYESSVVSPSDELERDQTVRQSDGLAQDATVRQSCGLSPEVTLQRSGPPFSAAKFFAAPTHPLDRAGVVSGAAEPANLGNHADDASGISVGFYFTAYLSGFGDDQRESQQKWSIAISLFQHALMQISS